ncbi:hypothetical protein SNEBB_009627 [Seison nebaliae]|nr:hypothetical protein SNEBB_009627 [Seison nebaliae]
MCGEKSDDNSSLLQISFKTTDDKLQVNSDAIAVPGIFTTKNFDELIQKLRSTSSNDQIQLIQFNYFIKEIPIENNFPFIDFLKKNEIPVELITEIHYEIKKDIKVDNRIKTNDWISSIHSLDSLILCALYDNSVLLLNEKGEYIATATGHRAAVKCVKWIDNHQHDGNMSGEFISSSDDGNSIVWKWNCMSNSSDEDENMELSSTKYKNDFQSLNVCKGHTKSVLTCSFAHNNSDRAYRKLVTGGYDRTIKLWNIDFFDEKVEESSAKKKKKDIDIGTIRPLITLDGHNDAITCLQWTSNNSNKLYSTSLDQSMKMWDIEECKTLQTIRKLQGLLCLDEKHNEILVGATDGKIRLLDMRANEAVNFFVSNEQIFTSHRNFVSSVKWFRNEDNQFLSGSYDGQVKIWDKRNRKKPLSNIIGHEGKVLSVESNKNDKIFSGGDDCFLHMYSK